MSAQQTQRRAVVLPAVAHEALGDLSDALRHRRSVRGFGPDALTLRQVAHLMWASQGITHADGLRTAPSAGALYPLEMYLVVGSVEGLAPGIYRYRSASHDLVLHQTGDRRARVAAAALNQKWMEAAAATILIAAEFERTTRKYEERGIRYVHIEAGHAGQNIALTAAALGLGTVFVGAFDDERVQGVLELPAAQRPLGLMPVGRLR
jgi:SagB-type dehydrogenase family enzyme